MDNIDRIKNLLCEVQKYNKETLTDSEFAELKTVCRLVKIVSNDLNRFYMKQTGTHFII